jgi:hypothetical protein
MGIDPMNNITIIIRILFPATLFQQTEVKISSLGERQQGDPVLDGELKLDTLL